VKVAPAALGAFTGGLSQLIHDLMVKLGEPMVLRVIGRNQRTIATRLALNADRHFYALL
jgi:hypothetical protein